MSCKRIFLVYFFWNFSIFQTKKNFEQKNLCVQVFFSSDFLCIFNIFHAEYNPLSFDKNVLYEHLLGYRYTPLQNLASGFFQYRLVFYDICLNKEQSVFNNQQNALTFSSCSSSDMLQHQSIKITATETL